MESAGEHRRGGRRADSRRRKGWAAVVPVLALLAVAAGIVTALWTQSQPSFGWFAYVPLSNETFNGGGLVYLDAGTKVGVALTAAGLLVLAFWSGYRTACRPPARRRAAHAGGPHPRS
ncbi:hypothetical protein [Arthrobacter sp. H35-D1]|uniref:hypothetical protein n=1 Tax=Arthrobacter sp. H35-D1 TaxID=3046202 RepID=UPI0024B883B3|nr:hypothetical protein [Arthrobacter sp. H35-D1]MDJ0314982.1 hypothetical protein [Arthrobacter sp. H35-D1]